MKFKNIWKCTAIVIIYIIGIYVSRYVFNSYPIDKEDINQNFYIAEYIVNNVFILIGIWLSTRILEELK